MLLSTEEQDISKYCDCVDQLIEAVKATTDGDWK
jgi:hypothetical protein